MAKAMIIAATTLLAFIAAQPAYAKSCGKKFVRVGTEASGDGPVRSLSFGTGLLAIDRWQKKVASDPDYGPRYDYWALADKKRHKCEVYRLGNKLHASCVTSGVPCRP